MKEAVCLFRYPCSGISSLRLADGVYIPNFPSTRWEIHPCGVAHLPTNFLRSGGRAVSVEPSLPRWCGWVDSLTLVPGGVRELYRALGLGLGCERAKRASRKFYCVER